MTALRRQQRREIKAEAFLYVNAFQNLVEIERQSIADDRRRARYFRLIGWLSLSLAEIVAGEDRRTRMTMEEWTKLPDSLELVDGFIEPKHWSLYTASRESQWSGPEENKNGLVPNDLLTGRSAN